MYTLKTYVYIRKDKIDKHGKAPVYLRITENGSRFEISLKVKVDADKWDFDAQRENVRQSSVNRRIEDALSRVNSIERKYLDKEKPSLEQVKVKASSDLKLVYVIGEKRYYHYYFSIQLQKRTPDNK